MGREELVVHGAREHNLKDVTVRLPRHKLICVTGLSGSGKSSLAFDTIYAEGQRRYRSEEHTSELQSRFGISYAVFCLKKKNQLSRALDTARRKRGRAVGPACVSR